MLNRTEQSDPDKLFQAGWAKNIVDETLRRLKTEYASSKRDTFFETLIPYLSSPIDNAIYQQVAIKMSISVGASKVAMHRLRQRFSQCLREVIEETVEDPSEVELELNELFQVLMENSILPLGISG